MPERWDAVEVRANRRGLSPCSSFGMQAHGRVEQWLEGAEWWSRGRHCRKGQGYEGSPVSGPVASAAQSRVG